MNFLFINGKFPQYSQTFVHDQIKELKSIEGNRVSVFAKSLTKFRFEDSVEECGKHILYAKPFDTRLARRIFLNFLLHPIRSLKIVYLKAFRKKLQWATLKLALQIQYAPDVAITHFGHNYKTAVELKKYLFPNMKNVLVFHGHDVSSYIVKHGWRGYMDASPYIDHAISVNNIWKKEIRDNTEIKNVSTIYLGTDISNTGRVPNGDDAYSILFVGRFVEKKGFKMLYEAVKELRLSERRKIRVHCVGDGPGLSHFKKKVAAEGASETFIFYGARQKSFVTKLMSECDLFVLPSKMAANGDCEGLPVVLMEAMAAGTPIISTYHSGIPELISDRETGLLVHENDTVALRSAISFAINNSSEMSAMADNAKVHVSIHHDRAIQNRKFVNGLRV